MLIVDEHLNGVKLIEPVVHSDHRGFLLESFNQMTIDALGISFQPVQDNHSLSKQKGTLRGLHFQLPPFAQAKLVRVVSGAIYDVVVDIRPGSSTFGQWRSYHLSAENKYLLFVPKGFAHGFCTLVDDTEVLYKVDKSYSPMHDAGILWSDAQLAIAWPEGDKVVSEKDNRHPSFSEFVTQGGS